jgi:integrase
VARDLISSDATIKAIRPGDKRKRLSDGDGLYLLLFVNGGSHGWRFDYVFQTRRKLISLGTYPDTSLALARRKADAARALVAEGLDPSAERQAERQRHLKSRTEQARRSQGLPPSDSFEAVAREWFEVRRSGWSKSYADKMMARFETDVFPWLGTTPIVKVTGPMLLEVLRRIEARGVIETAHRALQDSSQVFAYAMATSKLDRNPADKLKMVLRQPEPKNFPAITDPERFGQLLRACERYAATPVVRAALKLAPMLLLRPGEVRFAEWPEIDLDAALWTVPAARMKREVREKLLGAPHLVPLPRQAVAVLRELHELTGHATMVFRGERHHDRAMSENTINAALRAMGFSQDEVTGHGFRATARTMLHERLGFSPEIIEAQLAHSVRDSLGRAYNRTEFTEQRRAMMQAWADYLDQLRSGDVVTEPVPAPVTVAAPTGSAVCSPGAPARSSETTTAATRVVKEGDSASSGVSETPKDLSTLEASRFLNASHLFVVQEIEAGRLKSREVGADLRISMSDLVAYAVQVRLGGGGGAAPS